MRKQFATGADQPNYTRALFIAGHMAKVVAVLAILGVFLVLGIQAHQKQIGGRRRRGR